MADLWGDIRFAVRMLGRQKLLTAIAAITLALGMGVNTTIFSTVSGILWHSLPYPSSERLIAIWGQNQRLNFGQVNVSFREVEHYRQNSTALEDLTPYRWTQAGLRAAGSPSSIQAVETGEDFFRILQQAPAMGRTFLPEEQQPGDKRVAVITAGLWQREFGGDPNIVGREVLIDGRTHTIVGVMPPDFSFLYSRAEIFLPLRLTPEQRDRRDFRAFRAIGRLAPGKTVAQADAELKTLAKSLEDLDPAGGRGWSAQLRPLELDVIERGARISILTMFGAVFGVLLIACANVASLLLARGTLRQRELAIRASLGAGQARIARLLLTESLVLSLLGGAMAIVFAWWAIPLLRSLAPQDFPRLDLVQLDAGALGYTFLICLVTGLLAGAFPAWMLTRGGLSQTLREGGRGGTFSRQRVLQGLVTAEIALAMVLLTVTGLLVRSLSGQLLDAGFDRSNLMTGAVSLPDSLYPDKRRRAEFFRAAWDKLRNDGRVIGASAVQTLPLGETSSWTPILIEGRPALPEGERNLTGFMVVLPGYFDTMRIPMLAGRDFTSNDNLDAEPVAIINQTMARRYWPEDRQPLGRRLRLLNEPDQRAITVVGIARDVHHNGASRPPRPEMYVPALQSNQASLFLVVRTRRDIAPAASAIRDAVWTVDRNQPVAQLQTMDELFERRMAGPKVTVQILGFTGVLALLLSGLGIYGVLSYLTSQRSREIGIRMAIGAQRAHIAGLVARRGLILAAAGLLSGSTGAAAITPLIRNILDGVQPHDLPSFAWSGVALACTAILACVAPVARALRCDPVRILREE